MYPPTVSCQLGSGAADRGNPLARLARRPDRAGFRAIFAGTATPKNGVRDEGGTERAVSQAPRIDASLPAITIVMTNRS